ncbi:hypothetical protein ABNQ39_11370 [Azospirillum sp. A26]|uniref:hypothetical protein n=1 Tax=Azospirillum sp. A26 TaxID=3160607 RepID=UPI00366B5221
MNEPTDLGIILRAIAGGKTVAMTEDADRELHHLLGGRDLYPFGEGVELCHVPGVYGTPEFDVAWMATREAFAASGIELSADYRSDTGHARSAATCFVLARPVAGVQLNA